MTYVVSKIASRFVVMHKGFVMSSYSTKRAAVTVASLLAGRRGKVIVETGRGGRAIITAR